MRRSKAPLPLMELMVMLLVFALAAAICLRAFVKADQISKADEARDQAVTLCQNAAEIIKSTGGGLETALEALSGVAPGHRDGFGFFVSYDGSWTATEYDNQPHYAAYTLRAQDADSGLDGLGKAVVEVCQWNNGTMEPLFSLEVCWQEVIPHG